MATPDAPRNIASYAVDLVQALGADTVFSITGGMAMHLNRAAAAHTGLKNVFCQHEQACVAAAEGYAKAKDFRTAGFAIVTAGPGVSNAITSLISAFGDSTPLIVLAGQVKTADIDTFGVRTHGVQEVPSADLVRPCVKRFTRLAAEGFEPTLADTIVEAFSGRPGPVFMEIPLDVQGLPFDYTAAEIDQAVDSIRSRIAQIAGEGDLAPLAEALSRLLRAERPLLYVGNGCRVAGVEDAVRGFIARHRIPAVFSWLSFDILAGEDAFHFGCPGGLAPISANEILGAADTILFLGARLDLGTTAFQRADFGGQAERLFVDVDGAELAKFAGLPRVSCVQANLRSLPAAMDLASNDDGAREDWLAWCGERRRTYAAEERRRLTSGRMNIYDIATRLSKWSADKIFVSASSGYAEETFTRFFVPASGTRFFNGAALGAMGMGLANAIGAAMASRGQVVCMEADGGIMLNLQELSTLSHYAPKGFVLFIMNNGGYESIRASQTRHFGSIAGADRESGVFIPDFADVSRAFELGYRRVDSLAALEVVLSEASADTPPLVVDLLVERNEPRGPSVKTIMDAEGRPSTTPLSAIDW